MQAQEGAARTYASGQARQFFEARQPAPSTAGPYPNATVQPPVAATPAAAAHSEQQAGQVNDAPAAVRASTPEDAAPTDAEQDEGTAEDAAEAEPPGATDTPPADE